VIETLKVENTPSASESAEEVSIQIESAHDNAGESDVTREISAGEVYMLALREVESELEDAPGLCDEITAFYFSIIFFFCCTAQTSNANNPTCKSHLVQLY
jgi:hypothetical protein